MKKKLFALLAMVMTVMTASAKIDGYKLTAVETAEDKGTISFMIGEEAVESAEAGKTVTVKIVEVQSGFAAKSITVKAVAEWGAAKSRRKAIGLVDEIEAKWEGLNEFTFVMPEADVEVSAEYTYSAPAKAEEDKEDGEKVDDVTVNMEIVDGTTPTVGDDGVTTVEVTVTGIEIPTQEDASEQDKKEITVTINPVMKSEDGKTKFVVKSISVDAIKAAAGSNAEVTTLVIGESEEPVDIEVGAASPDGEPITVIVPLDMLDDYSTMLSLKENVDAGLVLAYAVPANMYWTFACGVDVELPDDVEAFTCHILNGDEVKIDPIPEKDLLVEGKRTIRHNNGVLLFNTSEKGGSYEMIGRLNGLMIATPATGNAMDYENNWLEPVIAKENYPAAEYLVLKDNEFHEMLDNASLTPACKALLRLSAPKAASARQMIINK